MTSFAQDTDVDGSVGCGVEALPSFRVQAKTRILMLSRYTRRGASSRVRLHAYIPALEAAGYSVTIIPFFSDDYIRILYGDGSETIKSKISTVLDSFLSRAVALLKTNQIDILWLEKEALPWLPYLVERVFLGRLPWIVDFDDAWFLRYSQSRLPLARRLLGHKLERLVKGASLAIVGNAFLARWANDAGSANIIELPTVVSLNQYPVRPMPTGRFTIGWIGTPLTAYYIEAIKGPLAQFCQSHGAALRVIGVPGFQMDGVSVEAVPWSEATEADEIAACHVGIMPLADTLWEQGKCGYKLIQFMAAGRPVIGSPIGVNSDIVNAQSFGMLARSANDWVTALENLSALPDRGAALGRQARRRIEARYNLGVTAPRLIEALRQISH